MKKQSLCPNIYVNTYSKSSTWPVFCSRSLSMAQLIRERFWMEEVALLWPSFPWPVQASPQRCSLPWQTPRQGQACVPPTESEVGNCPRSSEWISTCKCHYLWLLLKITCLSRAIDPTRVGFQVLCNSCLWGMEVSVLICMLLMQNRKMELLLIP